MVTQNNLHRRTDGDHQLDLELRTIGCNLLEIEHTCDAPEMTIRGSGVDHSLCPYGDVESRVL